MGKKNRAKKTDSDKSVKNKRDLMLMAYQLQQMCVRDHDRMKEWEFFTDLHKSVEIFRKKQKQALQTKPAKREDNVGKFKSWWMNHKVYQSNSIELKQFDADQGFGFVATKDIEENELLVKVPDSVMITYSNALSSYLGNLVREKAILSSMPNISLALFVHCEKYNQQSDFKPYLDIIPEDFNTALYFSPNEMLLLKGSTALGMAVLQYKAIVRQFAILYQILNESQSKYAIPKSAVDNFTFDAYRWAVSTLTTRQNQVPFVSSDGKVEQTLALIPLWDMFNHSPGKMSTHYTMTSGELECSSMKKFVVGEQVSICYGDRPNFELLIHNGFVIENHMTDFIRIPLGISSKDKLYDKKAKLLELFNMDVISYLPIGQRKHLECSNLIAFIRIFHISEENLDWWLNEAKDDDFYLLQFSEPDRECGRGFESGSEHIWKFLVNRLKLLIMSLERTIEGFRKEKQTTNKARMCVKFREQELVVLKRSKTMVEARMLKIEQTRMLESEQARMLESEQTRMSEEVQVAKICNAEACQNDTKEVIAAENEQD